MTALTWAEQVAEQITSTMFTTMTSESFVAVVERLAVAAEMTRTEVMHALWVSPGSDLTVEHVARFADALGVDVMVFFPDAVETTTAVSS